MRLNRDAYQQLVDEDLAWLEKQPRTLEREHIALIVASSADLEYGVREQRGAALAALRALLAVQADCSEVCLRKATMQHTVKQLGTESIYERIVWRCDAHPITDPERLLNGYRLDTAIDAERREARRQAALDDANLAWSGERRTVVVDLSVWRRSRR